VALSLDEAARDVVEWVEGQSLDWDIYVDLPENRIRYCFRSLADAMALKGRFCGIIAQTPEAFERNRSTLVLPPQKYRQDGDTGIPRS